MPTNNNTEDPLAPVLHIGAFVNSNVGQPSLVQPAFPPSLLDLGAPALLPDPEQTRSHILLLMLAPRGVVEVRALGVRRSSYGAPYVESGYFDDPDAAATAAGDVTMQATGVYVTLNPPNPALLARGANRLSRAERGATTSDGEIAERQFMVVDVDSVRPSGICATDAERESARIVARAVRDDVIARGGSQPAIVDTGNGFQLSFAIEEPADDSDLVKRCLHAFDALHSTRQAKVDTTCCNASRIVRLAGTLNRKGDSTADRPHRMARLIGAPASMSPLSHALLVQLASEAPAPPMPASRTAGSSRTPSPASRVSSVPLASTQGSPAPLARGFDLCSWLSKHFPEAEGPVDWHAPDGGVGRRWTLPVCPWNSDHTDSARVVQLASGALSAGCFHDSCVGKGWHDLRALAEGHEPVSPHADLSRSIVAMIQGDDRLLRLFRGQGRCGDGTAGAYDFALASALVERGIRDPDDLATAIAKRPVYALEPPVDDHLSGIVHRALQRHEEAGAAAADFTRRISKVRIYETRPPSYGFVIDGVEATLTHAEMETPKGCERRLGEQLHQVVSLGLKPKEWRDWINLLLRGAERVPMPADASPEAALRLGLADHIAGAPLLRCDDQIDVAFHQLATAHVLEVGDRRWVKLAVLQRVAREVFADARPSNALARVLKQGGWEYRELRVGSHGGVGLWSPPPGTGTGGPNE